jgi:hypothetical protein
VSCQVCVSRSCNYLCVQLNFIAFRVITNNLH